MKHSYENQMQLCNPNQTFHCARGNKLSSRFVDAAASRKLECFDALAFLTVAPLGSVMQGDQPYSPLEFQLASVPAFCVDLISKVKICLQHCYCRLVTEPKRGVSSIYRETRAGRL